MPRPAQSASGNRCRSGEPASVFPVGTEPLQAPHLKGRGLIRLEPNKVWLQKWGGRPHPQDRLHHVEPLADENVHRDAAVMTISTGERRDGYECVRTWISRWLWCTE